MDDWSEDLLRKYIYVRDETSREQWDMDEYALPETEMTMSASAVDYLDWDKISIHVDDWLRYLKTVYNFEQFLKPEPIDIDEFI